MHEYKNFFVEPSGLKSQLVKRYPSTDHATILRGLAALSVVLILSNGFSSGAAFHQGGFRDGTADFIINLGVYGPIIFRRI